jgi:hypothetical protein
MYSYSFGNGYDYEIAIAEQAFDCISKGCFDGLKRTMFIDESTESDEELISQMIDYLISDMNLKPSGLTSSRYDYNVPALTFYRTFYHNDRDSTLFQIKLELIYKSGLLFAKSINFIDKDLAFMPQEPLIYEHDKDRGSKTNIIPPPPISRRHIMYKARGVNLCSDCTQKKIITTDEQRRFWFQEKYEYEFIQQIGAEIYKVKQNGLLGIVNDKNEEIIPIFYDTIEMRFDGAFVLVSKEGKKGIYYKNEILLPVEYEEIHRRYIGKDNKRFSAIFIVKKGNLYGVLDSKAAEIIPINYEEADLFYSKYFKLKKNGLYGVANSHGEILCPLIYQEINFELPLFHGIMKATNRKGKRKILVFLEENGKTALKKVKNR